MNTMMVKNAQPRKKKSKAKGLIALVAILLILAIIGASGYFFILPAVQFSQMKGKIDSEDYAGAYQLYAKMINPSEKSTLAIEEMLEQHPTVALENAQVGDVVLFGRYTQGDKNSGNTPLEWIVLEVDEDKGQVFLITRYVIDCHRFNDSASSWKNSDIRSWLTGTFKEKAFNELESAAIKSKTHPNASKAEKYDQDTIFLLSDDEAEQYFATNEARVGVATRYARGQGSYTKDGGVVRWWLRTNVNGTSMAKYVDFDGSINSDGMNVNGTGDYNGADRLSVRPVMWVQY